MNKKQKQFFKHNLKGFVDGYKLILDREPNLSNEIRELYKSKIQCYETALEVFEIAEKHKTLNY